MKKSQKILLGIGIGLVVVIVAAVIIVSMFLGDIAKAGIETVGPQITKTSIKLDAVKLAILSGSVSVKGLVVGNPEGYKTPSAINVGTAAVGVDPRSVFSDKIVVRSIRIESPELTFEGSLSGNNFSKIMENVNAANKDQVQKSVGTNKTERAASSKKIEVDDFLITGAKVHGNITAIGGKEIKLDLTLPDIHLIDLGKGPNGITTTDLTKRMMAAVTAATLKAVSAAAVDLGKNAANAATGIAGTMATNSVDKISKGLGNLIGK